MIVTQVKVASVGVCKPQELLNSREHGASVKAVSRVKKGFLKINIVPLLWLKSKLNIIQQAKPETTRSS